MSDYRESNTGEWVLPKRLRMGIREALAGRNGVLRMDPQDLAERIGTAIDKELDRLARIRTEHAAKMRTLRALRQAEEFFVQRGISRAATDDARNVWGRPEEFK